MAKKTKSSASNHHHALHRYLHFRNTNEFIIFMVWALFVSVFLLTVVK